METDLIQDGGQVKRQTDSDHHGPKYILIICHLPDPPTFSLPTTFKSDYDSIKDLLYLSITIVKYVSDHHSLSVLCFLRKYLVGSSHWPIIWLETHYKNS